MKQILKYCMAMAFVLVLFPSCEKETEGISRITYYCDLELEGASTVAVEKGANYVEVGYTAKEGDEDVTDKVVVSGLVNTSEVGFYTLVYSVKNQDGFAKTAERRVFVVDNSSIASAYFGEVQTATRHYINAPIMVTDLGNDEYGIDDLFGGYYFWGIYPGYEPNYDFHAEGVVKIIGSTITFVSVGSAYFAPPAFTSGTYDAATGTITIVLGTLTVTLTKSPK